MTAIARQLIVFAFKREEAKVVFQGPAARFPGFGDMASLAGAAVCIFMNIDVATDALFVAEFVFSAQMVGMAFHTPQSSMAAIEGPAGIGLVFKAGNDGEALGGMALVAGLRNAFSVRMLVALLTLDRRRFEFLIEVAEKAVDRFMFGLEFKPALVVVEGVLRKRCGRVAGLT